MKFLNLNLDALLGGDSASDYESSSQKAVKTYVDNSVSGILPSKTGKSGKYLKVNSDASGVEWADASAGRTYNRLDYVLASESKPSYTISDGFSSVQVYLDGVITKEGSTETYQISGNVISFNDTLPKDTEITIVYYQPFDVGTLPIATASSLGTVKVGSGLNVTSDGTLSTDGTGSVTSVRVQATSPVVSSQSTAQTSTLDTTISLEAASANTVLAGPSSGSSSASPTYRSLVADDIPSLDGGKITTGTLDVERIPDLSADKITSGTLGTARIPSLSASKITSGTFATDRIPELSASKITSDTLDTARIPSLDASKITSGIFSLDRIPVAAKERCVVVTNDAARWSLTTDDVQNGDTVKVTYTNKMYFVIDDTKLDGSGTISAEDAFEEYKATADWSTVTNKPNVSAIGGSGKYISSVSQADGELSAVATDLPDVNNVTQTNSTANSDFRLLLSGSANDTSEANTSKKSSNFVANPSTGDLTVGGKVTGSQFIRDGGTSSQFLKADGSVDSSAYLTASSSLDATKLTGTASIDTTGNASTATTATDYASSGGIATALAGKQSSLSEAQLNAANSGITSSKVSTYDGYATTLSGKVDKSTLTTKGDIYYASAASTPTRLGIGSNGQVLKVVSGVPAWSSDSDTNTKVTQTNSTTNASYRLLLSASANDTTETNTSLKSGNFIANPSTGDMTITGAFTAGRISSDSGPVVGVTVTSTSDERLKKDIVSVDRDLSHLEAKHYTLIRDGEEHIGLIAQEVMKTVPEAVLMNPDGYYSLDYNSIVALLVNKVNQLEKRVKELENK